MRIRTEDGVEAVLHRLVAVGKEAHYLSFGGTRESVEAIWGAFATQKNLVVVAPERLFVWRSMDELKYRRARIGQVVHGLITSEAVGERVVVWTSREEAAANLARALNLPILPEWVEWFKEAVKPYQKNLTAIGIEALYLPPSQVREIKEMLASALRGGELPIPEEALCG